VTPAQMISFIKQLKATVLSMEKQLEVLREELRIEKAKQRTYSEVGKISGEAGEKLSNCSGVQSQRNAIPQGPQTFIL